MEQSQFWQLIQTSKVEAGGDTDAQAAILEKKLKALPAEEIVQFDRILHEMMALSYRWDLWGAAYVINGGCSDDCFDDFRGYLISMGRKVYEGAIRDPDTLTSFRTTDWEGAGYATSIAYERATGGKQLPFVGPRLPDEPSGNAWEESELP